MLPDIGSSEIFARYEDSLDEETILQAEEKARGILHNVWDIDSLNIERIGAVEFYNADSTFRDFSVYFCPVYHNIPYLMCPYAFYDVKGYSPMPQNLIHAFWRENIEFEGAGISIPRVIGEHVQDVPLLPFSKIQESIRQRIQEGYIQSICEIRLGYICCNNPEHPGEEFYLTPAWVVCGVMNSLPNLPFYPQEYLNMLGSLPTT